MKIKFKLLKAMCKCHITCDSTGDCDYCNNYANEEHHMKGSCRKELCFMAKLNERE